MLLMQAFRIPVRVHVVMLYRLQRFRTLTFQAARVVNVR